MAYQRKHTCYRCEGKGKGVIEGLQSDWDKTHLDWIAQLACPMCDGKGYNDYDFRPEQYLGVWDDVDWENVDIDYEDISAKYNCSCGDEIFFSEEGSVVCKCGRIYRLSIKILVDSTHLDDIEYWEKYEDKNST